MQSETLLTGKQRNDWTRSRQGLLALRAYGELVTQFPTNHAAQVDKIKSFYDALVNEETPPKGCTRAMLLCPWRSTAPTEMKGQEILNKALATRLEVRDVIVPAAMKIMVGGKLPSGKSEDETLGLILDLLWTAQENKRVAVAAKRVQKIESKPKQDEDPDQENKAAKTAGAPPGIRPIKATRPPDFQPVGWVAFMALSPLWNPGVKPAVFRVMLDPRQTFDLQPAERAAVSRQAMRQQAKDEKGWVNKEKNLVNTAASAACTRAAASQVAAASMALQALHQAADRREARLEKAIAMERDPIKRAALETALMAVLTTDIKPSRVLLETDPDDTATTEDSATEATQDTDPAGLDTSASSTAPLGDVDDEEEQDEGGLPSPADLEADFEAGGFDDGDMEAGGGRCEGSYIEEAGDIDEDTTAGDSPVACRRMCIAACA